MSMCHALAANGKPCEASARFGSHFCIFHDEEYKEEQLENSVAGGLASGVARKPLPLSEIQLDFSSREGIQASLEAVARLELIGRVSASRARDLIRLLSIASRNFDIPPAKSRRNDFRANLDERKLESARHDLNKNLAPIAEEAAIREAARDLARNPPKGTPASLSQVLRAVNK